MRNDAVGTRPAEVIADSKTYLAEQETVEEEVA